MIKWLFEKRSTNFDVIFVGIIIVLMAAHMFWWAILVLVVAIVVSTEMEGRLLMMTAHEKIEADRQTAKDKPWKDAVNSGHTVEAIKLYRSIYGVGLVAAKDAVMGYQQHMRAKGKS